MRFKSHFLRLLYLFYSNFALQLKPVYFKKWLSIGNLVWTTLLFLFTEFYIYSGVFSSLYSNLNAQFFNATVNRKLFLKLYSYLILTTGFLTNFSIFCYFVIINFQNNQLFKLLDSFNVKSFNKITSSKQFFVVIFLINQTINVLQFPPFLFQNKKSWDKPDIFVKLILSSICFYLIEQSKVIIFGIVIYYRYATWKSLQMMKKKIKNNFKFEHFQIKLQHLAMINKQLNSLMSFPLTCKIFVSLVDYIVFIFYYINHIEINISIVFFWVFIIFAIITLINRLVQKELHQIKKLLTKNSEKLFIGVTKNNKYKSDLIQKQELISIYQQYFCLNLFSFCQINSSFWLNSAIIIINYLIIVIQTQ